MGGALSLTTHLGKSFPALARQVRRTAEFSDKLLRIKGSRKQRRGVEAGLRLGTKSNHRQAFE